MSSAVISVIGAGGKTTCIHLLADKFKKEGRKVLLTTTTQMMWESRAVSTLAEIKQGLEKENYVIAGSKNERGKMCALPEPILTQAIALADVVLIEADGAKRKPWKALAPWEPVIVPQTTKILLIAGLSAIGRPIGEVTHRTELVCEILNKTPDEILTCQDMADVLTQSYLKRIKEDWPDIPVQIWFNQGNSPKALRDAAVITKRISR